ncbi:MAG: ABC transporter permease [Nitriliruptor sp.]|uniref:ABC transporter permease n=1 Tax=Nitriliruptor sp. TaxID=2448056 RepID=UPI00349FF302
MSAIATPAATLSPRHEEVIAAAAAQHRRAVRRERLVIRSSIIGIGVFVLLFWEFGLGYLVEQRYVSTPSAVLERLIGGLQSGQLLRDTRVTFIEASSGYVIGVVVGLVGAFFLALSRRAYEVLEPYLLWFYSIPKIALAPLFIMWFGLGYMPKVLLAALMVFFIVFMNTVAGVHSINRGLLDVSRVFGASKLALVTKVMFPAAAPAIMAGIRITFSRAMVGAILAEFIASTQGLGFMIVRGSRQFDIATVFAGIVVVAALVMTVNAFIRWLEGKLLPWSKQEVHG